VQKNGTNYTKKNKDIADLGEITDESFEDVETTGLNIQTYGELKVEPITWTIRRVIPDGSCCVIGAEQKTGKTFWLLDLAISVSTGYPFFGCQVTKPGNVLIYSPEGKRSSRVRRLHGLMTGHGFDAHDRGIAFSRLYFIEDSIDLTSQASLRDISIAVMKLKPRILILDPLASCYDTSKLNENDASIQQALNNVRGLLKFNEGMSIIVAHHSRKGKKDNETAFDTLRGSSAIAGWLDCLISLKSEADKIGSTITMGIYLRDGFPLRPISYTMNISDSDFNPEVKLSKL
jgi:RecA-family ATPase